MIINNNQQQILLNQQSLRPQISPPPPPLNFDGNIINNYNINSSQQQQPLPLFGGLGGGQTFNNNCGGGIFATTTTTINNNNNTFSTMLNQNNKTIINSENGCSGGGHRQINNGQSIPGAWFFPPQSSELVDSSTALGSPCSPGLMAPQQLLARFGPRHSTDSVEVPSSEHVAEIVGRQGCKIKALRAKTNTYIKTPVRGEEPVFVVTGRHEDVIEARREIECAAEHFTQIRASRRHSQGACPAPGHVTAYVRVPLRVVGLVVGPKGNTIKRIQQDTHTYIITPSREREPIFEVTGLPENVEAARREIENHIYQRTGNMPLTDPNASIANFDLNSAALHAQQSALQSNSINRPNYGALAVVCPRSNNNNNFGGEVNNKDDSSSPYFQQQNNGGLNSNNNFINTFGGQQTNLQQNNEIEHHYMTNNNNIYNNNISSIYGINNNNYCPPSSVDLLHNSTTSNSAASSNDLHLFFNSLELDGPINNNNNCVGNGGSVKMSNFGAIGDPHPAQENQKRQQQQEYSCNQLFGSISNELLFEGHQQQQNFDQFNYSNNLNNNNSFSPWTTTTISGGEIISSSELNNNGIKENKTKNGNSGGVDIFDIFSSTSSSSPLPFSFSTNGTKCY